MKSSVRPTFRMSWRRTDKLDFGFTRGELASFADADDPRVMGFEEWVAESAD